MWGVHRTGFFQRYGTAESLSSSQSIRSLILRARKGTTIVGTIWVHLTTEATRTHPICTLIPKILTSTQLTPTMIRMKSPRLRDIPKSLILNQTSNMNQQHTHPQFPNPTLPFLNLAIITPITCLQRKLVLLLICVRPTLKKNCRIFVSTAILPFVHNAQSTEPIASMRSKQLAKPSRQ